MAPLVQLGCKGNIYSSCFHMFIVRILCFFKQYHAGLEEVILIVLAPIVPLHRAMTYGISDH